MCVLLVALMAGYDMPYQGGFDTCLGDLYSVAWMEDAECEDGRKETLQVRQKWRQEWGIACSRIIVLLAFVSEIVVIVEGRTP
jgi:hypothetical protein